MENVLKDAIAIYGASNQCDVAIEEMSELIKEICKHKRGERNLLEVAEETADVKIMIEQLEMIFCMKELVEIFKDQKVKRLEERIASHGRDNK